jgi:hypothetical protein
MDMTYTHILDTLNRCKRLALRFTDLRDQVDGLLMTGPNVIARYSPSTGSTSHGTSDPVYDYVQRIDALTAQMQAVWNDFKSADYKARVLISELNITPRERDVLDAYYRELSSEYVISTWFVDQSPPIRNADDLNRARQGVLRKIRRKRYKLVTEKSKKKDGG